MTSKKSPNEYYDSLIGKEILGAKGVYKIKRKIGVGGMGAVFEATNTTDSNRIAIKIISPHLGNNQTFIRRFQREAKVGWVLSHPNIIKVHEFGETGEKEDKLYFMAMEFVEGESLKSYLSRSGPLPANKCVEILRPLCEGLETAHKRKILHRDLKPDNIMLTTNAEGKETVKLADFGLVKLLEPDSDITKGSNLTQAGEVFGTPHYMAPEQVLGQPTSISSDIYSLGVMTYQMLTGKLPVEANDVKQLLILKVSKEPPVASKLFSFVNEAFDPILSKALARSPDDRYSSVGDFFKDFQKIVIQLSDTGKLKVSEEAMKEIRKDYVVEDPSSGVITSTSLPTSTKHQKTDTASDSEAKEAPKSNSTLMIVGGVVILVVIIAAIMILK